MAPELAWLSVLAHPTTLDTPKMAISAMEALGHLPLEFVTVPRALGYRRGDGESSGAEDTGSSCTVSRRSPGQGSPVGVDQPDCDGHDVGEYWEPDECNECLCTEDGPVCTVEDCENDPGRATPYPGCDGHALGETWSPDDCNLCVCTENGSVCTVKDCESTQFR